MPIKIDLDKYIEYAHYKNRIVLEGIIGSQSHGTYMPQHPDTTDDIDLMGLCVLPNTYYYGFQNFGSRGTLVIQRDQYDIVLYDIRKAVKLMADCNPNMISLLFLEDNFYTIKNKYGKLLVENRNIFLSKKAYKTFSGYAYSQLKKMEHNACEGYMGEKRKNLVKKYGYDCKNASHCIRLLNMCLELLVSKELNVMRHDRAMLMDIKFGKWSLEQVKAEAANLFKLIQEAYIKSDLPLEPDYGKIEKLLIDIIDDTNNIQICQ